jgi:DNA-binding transcriptional LysR family regulator
MIIDSENTNVGLRHLLAAVTIREEGSFVRAAERLNVAPSALTETIRQLEAFVGLPLFDRSTRPALPGAEASIFLEDARDILTRFETLMTDLRRIGSLQLGVVRVGVAPSIALHLLAPALTTFRAEHPKIDIEVYDDVAGKVADLVREGIVDMGIVARGQSDPELAEEFLLNDRFGLVCHREHPLARREGPLVLADVDPGEIISLKAEAGIKHLLEQHPHLPESFRSGRIQTYSTISQLTLISRNLGVALMPQLAADVIQSQEIVFRQIEDLVLERSFFVLSRTRSQLTASATRLLHHIKRELNLFLEKGGL